MNNRLVSVIMSVYNEEERWVSKAINSILNQTYTNLELIVVLDNPSNINLKNYLEMLIKDDNRVQIIENEKNIGLPMSLNKAIDLCKGYYIARMDADDISYENRIYEQVKFMENNTEIDLVGSNSISINEDDEVVKGEKLLISDHEKICKLIPYGNFFIHPTLMFKASAIKNIGGYRSFRYAQDYDLICRFITSGFKLSNLNKSLLYYRERSGSITGKNSLAQYRLALYIVQLYKQRLKYGNDTYDNKVIDNIVNTQGIKLEKYKQADIFYKKSKLESKFSIKRFYYMVKSITKSKYKIIHYYNIAMFKIKYRLNDLKY